MDESLGIPKFSIKFFYFFLAIFTKTNSLRSVKRKLAFLLTISLSLLILCKSSLLDLCPTFETQKPTCHQQESKSSPPTGNCDCPYAYTELKFEDSKSYFQLSDSTVVFYFSIPSKRAELLLSIEAKNPLVYTSYSSTYQFLETIRLTT